MYTPKANQPDKIGSPTTTHNCQKQVVVARETSQNFFGSRWELYVTGAALQTDERAVEIEKQGEVSGPMNFYPDFRPGPECMLDVMTRIRKGATYNSFFRRFEVLQNDSNVLLLQECSRNFSVWALASRRLA